MKKRGKTGSEFRVTVSAARRSSHVLLAARAVRAGLSPAPDASTPPHAPCKCWGGETCCAAARRLPHRWVAGLQVPDGMGGTIHVTSCVNEQEGGRAADASRYVMSSGPNVRKML